MKFKSAVDWWFYLIILVLVFALLRTFIPAINTGEMSIVFAFGMLVLALGLPLWLMFSTHYQVLDADLKIQAGPFSWRVPLAEIKSAEPSLALWSSPALSLDRIDIRYGDGKRILVSPADKPGFLKAIGMPTFDS